MTTKLTALKMEIDVMSNVNINKRGSFCSYLSAVRALPTAILPSVTTETSASSASSTVSNGASRIRDRKEDLTRYSRPTCPHSIAVGGTAFVLNARFSLNCRESILCELNKLLSCIIGLSNRRDGLSAEDSATRQQQLSMR